MAQRKSPDDTFTLFITLPTDGVCTLRGLRSGVTVNDVKSRLELAAGIPSHIYMLTYPDGECLGSKERLLIQENVRDGYLLRVHLHESWEELYFSVLKNNTEHVYHGGGVHLNDSIMMGESGQVDIMVNDRANVALFLACYHGMIKMCNMLLTLGLNVNDTTHFGRSPVHAAVCKDHVLVLNMLLDRECDVSMADANGHTPIDVARIFHSHKCERRLRLASLNLRGLSKSYSGASSTSSTYRKIRVSSVPHQVLSERNPSPVLGDRQKAGSACDIRRPKEGYRNARWPDDVTSGQNSRRSLDGKSDRYWIVSLTPHINNRIQKGIGEKISVISPTELSLPNGKFRVIKFRKDSKDNTATGHQNEAERCKTPHIPRIMSPSSSMRNGNAAECHDETQSYTTEARNKQSPENRNDVEESAPSETVSRKSSLRGIGPKQHKIVRFSAKARSIRTLPRPETIESFKQMKRKINIAAGQSRPESKYSNMTHERWLQRKKKLETKMRPEGSSSSSDDDDGNDGGDSEAFKEWLRKKRDGPDGPPRHPTGNRPVPGLIKIGSTAVGDGRNPDPVHNLRAYREWLNSRRRVKKAPNIERMKTMQNFMEHKRLLEEKRQEMLLTAISYEEWMDHTEDRKSVIRRILSADMEQLKLIEEEKIKARAPHQISHADWKSTVKKRDEEERAKLGLKQKQEEEESRDQWRGGRIRTTAAIPHSEWLKLKRGHLQVEQTSPPLSSPRESHYDSEKTRREAELSYNVYTNTQPETGNDVQEAPLGQEFVSPIRHPRLAEVASC